MKSLEEYSKERLLNEGKIRDFLKKAWDWFIGKREDTYNPSSYRYNEKEKIKYINQYNAKNIEIKNVENTSLLVEIIRKSLSKDDPKCGFFKLNEYFRKNPSDKNITESNKFLALVFKSEKVSESCGLIGYTTEHPDFKGKTVVYIVELLNIYKYLIDIEEIANKLKEIDENIIILDSYLLSQFDKYDIETVKVEGNKNGYTLK